MTDKDFSRMSDGEFDELLGSAELDPPSAAMVYAVNPWRRAMSQVLWGLGLTTMTLNLWNLNTILPALGMILLALGFRALRQENKWFRTAYRITLVRAVWWFVTLFAQTTVFRSQLTGSTLFTICFWAVMALVFWTFLCLRNGIRAVQRKAGLTPHGGTAPLVWYGVMLCLGLLNFGGLLAWPLIIAYFFLFRGLWKLSRELEEAGYAIRPVTGGLSDRGASILYWSVLVLVLAAGYLGFRKYPMDWHPFETAQSVQVQAVREELTALGFPEYVLDDLTEEEILGCQGADYVIVEVQDYDFAQTRPIFTQAEMDARGVYGLTPEEGEAQLRTTYIGLRFPGDRESYRIIHHFEWLTETDFVGTECIQMWDDSSHWQVTGQHAGRVLYDLDGGTYAAGYYSLGKVTYQTESILSAVTGQTTSTDIFAAYSFPNGGTRYRGYILYDIAEVQEGGIVDSWFNMTHQYSLFQFPVKTAVEFEMTSFTTDGTAFRTIQTALQFTTHEDVPKFFWE